MSSKQIILHVHTKINPYTDKNKNTHTQVHTHTHTHTHTPTESHTGTHRYFLYFSVRKKMEKEKNTKTSHANKISSHVPHTGLSSSGVYRIFHGVFGVQGSPYNPSLPHMSKKTVLPLY